MKRWALTIALLLQACGIDNLCTDPDSRGICAGYDDGWDGALPFVDAGHDASIVSMDASMGLDASVPPSADAGGDAGPPWTLE